MGFLLPASGVRGEHVGLPYPGEICAGSSARPRPPSILGDIRLEHCGEGD